MPAFISHSFENAAEFDNVVDALKLRQVPYWNPSEVKPGASLREQLRLAVDRCEVCVFVATRRSIDSSWCGAELGAFWGAGKQIIVYVAEPSLTDEELPPIVRGDVWERRIARIADRVKELIEAAALSPTAPPHAASSLGQLTIEQFEKLLVGALSLGAALTKDDTSPATVKSVESAVRRVAGNVLSGFRAAGSAATNADDTSRYSILWVDDHPDHNEYERQAMESMGLEFTLARSTAEALRLLAERKFAAIISDMGRKEGPREGYTLLDAVRVRDPATPFFIYTGPRAGQHQREAASRGAQGTTNNANELVTMITSALKSGT